MDVLFIHQSMPGQFLHLARRLASDPQNRVVFLTRPVNTVMSQIVKLEYDIQAAGSGGAHPYMQNLQNGILHGEAVARSLISLQKRSNFRPAVIYGHPGWGETLFIKDVFPSTPLIHYCEFFYHGLGADTFFDHDEPVTPPPLRKVRTKNAVNMIALDACDFGVTPTRWQHRLHPKVYQPKIKVIHDGIDVQRIAPNINAQISLASGQTLDRSHEVVTYVNRTLEPCRGLYTFMRAAEIVAKRRPQCQFVIVGAEIGNYYGQRPPQGKTFKEIALSLVDVAKERLHFLGRMPHAEYLKVLQISTVHVYLSSPFVLSWSMLEAMSTGCVVVGSNTPPVVEVIEDGRNGLLADFFAADEVAERLIEAIEDGELARRIREEARDTIVQQYSLERSLSDQLALIGAAAGAT